MNVLERISYINMLFSLSFQSNFQFSNFPIFNPIQSNPIDTMIVIKNAYYMEWKVLGLDIRLQHQHFFRITHTISESTIFQKIRFKLRWHFGYFFMICSRVSDQYFYLFVNKGEKIILCSDQVLLLAKENYIQTREWLVKRTTYLLHRKELFADEFKCTRTNDAPLSVRLIKASTPENTNKIHHIMTTKWKWGRELILYRYR